MKVSGKMEKPRNENSEQLKNLEKNKNPERKASYWLIRKHS